MNNKLIINIVDNDTNDVIASLLINKCDLPKQDMHYVVRDIKQRLCEEGNDKWQVSDVLERLPFGYQELESIFAHI